MEDMEVSWCFNTAIFPDPRHLGRQGLHPNMAPAIPILIYIMLGCCLSLNLWRDASKKSLEKPSALTDNQLLFGSHTF